MYYIVTEIQKTLVNNDVSVAQITTVHSTRSEAENKYHTVLAYAAISGILSHSATMLDEKGYYIKSECYVNNEIPPAEENPNPTPGPEDETIVGNE